MSFFSDLFEGNFNKLGTDITHAPESLAKHPSELYETLGGAAALATGGLALGGLGALGGEAAAGAGGLGELFGGGSSVLGGVGDSAALDAFAAGATPEVAPAVEAASVGGSIPLPTASPFAIGDLPDAGALVSGYGGSSGGGLTDLVGSYGASGGASAVGGADVTGALPAATASTGGTAGAGATPSWLSSLGITPLKAAGVALGAGALGYDVLQGRKPLADQSALQGTANQLSAQGQQFMSYLQQGKLPAGLQTLVDKQTQAAKAMAIANAAKNGQSTDPTTNTQLADAINSAQQQATAQVAQLGEQLFKQGMDETQVSAQIMQYLTNLDEQQTQSMGKSIAAFAASLAGGGGTTLKIAA